MESKSVRRPSIRRPSVSIMSVPVWTEFFQIIAVASPGPYAQTVIYLCILWNKRPMGLDAFLDDTDRSSKRIVTYGKQMYQITLQITINVTNGIFETRAQNNVKMTLNTKRSKVPHVTCYNYPPQPRVPNFSPYRSRPSHFHFRITSHFECTKWPQNDLEH